MTCSERRSLGDALSPKTISSASLSRWPSSCFGLSPDISAHIFLVGRDMKKKLFLLSTVGAAAAGLVYALETNRRKQAANKNESTRENGKASATNGRSAAQTTPDKPNGHRAGPMAHIENGTAPASEA